MHRKAQMRNFRSLIVFLVTDTNSLGNPSLRSIGRTVDSFYRRNRPLLAIFQPSRQSNIFPLLTRCRIAEVFPALLSKRLKPDDNVWVLVGDVVRLADVRFEIEERQTGLALRVFPRLAIVARRFGMIV